MNKDFVPYQESLELKELGFDEPCFGDYFKFEDGQIILDTDDDRDRIVTDNPDEEIEQILTPTFSQAFRWFREKYKLHCHIEYISAGDVYEWWIKYDRANYPTYEEAELACLRKLIEIVKNK